MKVQTKAKPSARFIVPWAAGARLAPLLWSSTSVWESRRALPTSKCGANQQHPARFCEPQKKQFLEIKEFTGTYTKLERKSFRLGGPSREVAAGTQGGTETVGNNK